VHESDRPQRSASSRYAVETKMVTFSRSSWYRMRQKSRRETGSTPLVGSSRNSTLGVWTSAQARPSFCFHAPDSLPA